MAGQRHSKTAWACAVVAFAAFGLTYGDAAGQNRPSGNGPVQNQKGRSPRLEPAAIKASKLKIRLDWVGRATTGNLTSPVVAGNQLLLISQQGSIDVWNGTNSQSLLTLATLPAGVTPIGAEVVSNIAANDTGNRVYVMFTSTTVPGGIPQRFSPRPGADAWHVLYAFDFDGAALSNPVPVTALQVRSDGHTGGGMVMVGDWLLFATGDNGDSGEDGREYAQDAANHLGKIIRINVATGATEIAAVGMRNVQRLIVDPNAGDPYLIAADIGGWVAEEIDALPLGDLLSGGPLNCGWGRSAADSKAREGTFYIDVNGLAAGAAPLPEAGFIQPIAQFGRERAEFVGLTGTVASAVSFNKIRYAFGDLVSGSVYAVTGTPTTSSQSVFRVTLVNSTSQVISLTNLVGGGRPDPRFFNFPDGTAGMLLEATGDFYRLTEVR